MQRYNLIPIVLFVVGAVSTLMLGSAVDRSEIELVRLETSITGEQVRLRLESCVDQRVGIVNAIAAPRWNNQQELLHRWDVTANILLNLSAGVQALNYIDND